MFFYQISTLTEKIDIIPSASENNSGNDLIIGSDTTLNAGDRIDGGAGNDTLTIATGNANVSLAGVDIKNVENFAFSGKTKDAGVTVDVATFSELEHLSFKNFETTGLTVTTMVDKGVITLGGAVKLGTATVDFVDTATTANFTLDQLNSEVAVTLSGKGLTTVNVTGNTHSATTGGLGIMNDTLTTLNIDSSTAARVKVNSTKLATVNGTTSKGDVKLYIEPSLTDLTVNLGAGDDEMWIDLAGFGKSDKINMGAGEDILGINVKAATELMADHYAAIKATVDTESVGFFVSHSTVSADSSTTFTADAAQLGGKDIFLDGSTLAGTKTSGSVVLNNVADSQLITSSMQMTDAATHATLTITSDKGTLGTVSIVAKDKNDWLNIDAGSEFGTLNLSGAGNVLVTEPTAKTHAISIEAKGLTGTLIATGGGMKDFITAGSGGSTITGGAGADKITLGAGADKVVLGNVTDGGIDTVTGFGKGDTLAFGSDRSTTAVKVVDATFDSMADVATVLGTFANNGAHAAQAADGTAAVFTYKGDTYVLINVTNDYSADTDAVVHLAGVTADQVVEMGDIFVAAS